jgi:hypothetical protein
MKQLDSIFAWFSSLSTFVKVASSVIILIGLGVGIISTYNNLIIKKHDSKLSIDLKQVKDTLAYQGEWLKGIDSKMNDITNEFSTTKSNVNALQGAYYVLDRSYVRTLEKTLRASEELSTYKDEKIISLQEALKKKEK